MNKKRLIMRGLIAAAMLFIVALPCKTQAKEWPSILLGATTLKGSYYPVMVALAEQLKKHANIKATPVTLGSSGAIATLMGRGECQVGLNGSFVLQDAYLGKGTFAKKGRQPLRAIMSGHVRVTQYVTRASSGIKKPEDLRGKKFMFLQPGAPGTYNMGWALLDAYGLRDKVKVLKWKSTGSMANAVKEGLADVGLTGAPGSAAIMELARTTKIHFIPLSKEAQDKITNKLYPPFLPGVVPKGLYGAGNPPQDVRTLSLPAWLICRSDLPVELVYEIARVILDYPEEFGKYHVASKQYKLDKAIKNPVIAFHPGAIEYYKSKGMWGPKEDKVNINLLKKIL
jgi:TRAP transporter TAXI family solute receptor